MKAQCPHCNQSYPELDDQLNGQIVTCGKCNQEFVAETIPFPQTKPAQSLKKSDIISTQKVPTAFKVADKAFYRIPWLIIALNIASIIAFLYIGFIVLGLFNLPKRDDLMFKYIPLIVKSFFIGIGCLIAGSALAFVMKLEQRK